MSAGDRTFIEACRDPEAKVSGGHRDGMEQGWGIAAFQSNVAHFWTVCKDPPPECGRICQYGRIDYYTSACGLSAVINASRRPMLGPGSFPACKKCLKRHAPPTDTSLAIDEPWSPPR